jgi:hypothetical protein
MLPQQEAAALAALALKIGLDESALRMIKPQEAADLANLAHQQASSEAKTRLLPGQERLAQKGIEFQSAFLDEAGRGVDAKGWMDEAQAGVQHGYKLASKALRKDISSFGLDPGAGRYASQNRATRMDEATGVAGARTGAQRAAEAEDFRRKQVASTGLTIPKI